MTNGREFGVIILYEQEVKRVHYQLDLDSTEPIYQQLSMRIMEDIRRGTLPRGSKLPTVRDLAEEMKLARGTIKRAYDELERLGAIEMTQGRGSYVCWQEENAASRKVRAMRAIDDMLDELEGLGFSAAEISIFLELKQRERMETEHHIPLALVSSCEETLRQAADQLKNLPGVELYTYSLKALRTVSGKLAEEYCLVVTDDFLFDVVRGMVGDDDRIVRVAYEPTMETIRELSRIPSGSRIGIFSHDADFGGQMIVTCRQIVEQVRVRLQYLGDPARTEAFLRQLEYLVLPQGYQTLCTEEEREILRAWEDRGHVILYDTCIDRGSMLVLQSRLSRMRGGN